MRKEGSRSALFLFIPTLLSTQESTGTLPDLLLPSSFLSSWVLRSFPVRAVDRKRTGSISRSFLNYELLIVPASQEVYAKYTLCLSRSALKTGQASHSSVTKKTHSVSPVSRVNFPVRPLGVLLVRSAGRGVRSSVVWRVLMLALSRARLPA